ncbi:MAG: transporter, partial [Dechloromonas sp.]|nr:transporter [Dechloromonas sp.]
HGWRLGLVAAWVQQLTDDKGSLADRLNGFRGYSVAAGAIVTYATKLSRSQPLDLSLRWTPSVASKNRMAGNAFTFAATVPF